MRLNATLKPHRACLPAHADGGKLFVALDLRVASPTGGSSGSTNPDGGVRPSLGVLFLVDTSGSMTWLTLAETEEDFYDKTSQPPPPGASRLDAVIDALRQLVKSGQAHADDRFALAHFDDQADTLIGFTSPREQAALGEAIDRLKQHSGGTQMGRGMHHVLSLLGDSSTAAKKLVVLTDGNTADEDAVLDIVGQLEAMKVSVSPMGVGADWNAQLLNQIAARTNGIAFHIADDSEEDLAPKSVRRSQFASHLIGELERAAAEVVRDVTAVVNVARGVRLLRLTRVRPSVSDVLQDRSGFPLGNVGMREGAAFLLEFALDQRVPSRVRLAQLGLTYRLVGSDARAEVAPRDLVVDFSADEARTSRPDDAVMNYVATRNVIDLAAQAVKEAESDPARAAQTLQRAEGLSDRLDDPDLTKALQGAVGQLHSGKTIRLSTQKTLLVGARNQTTRSDGVGGLSDEDIRRITGV